MNRAGPRPARERLARRRERLPFELPAADRAVEGAVGAHDHAGAGLARRRAHRGMDGHERGGAVLRDDLGEAPPDGHGIAPPAHRLAGAQDRLRRRRRVERNRPVGRERMDRVGDGAEDADREHQRRLADRLRAVDRLLPVAVRDRARRGNPPARRRRPGSCRSTARACRSRPSSSKTSSSVVSQPMPCTKPPSIWPMSIAGFSERPQSCRMSMRVDPVLARERVDRRPRRRPPRRRNRRTAGPAAWRGPR